jgi:hypothetical protein
MSGDDGVLICVRCMLVTTLFSCGAEPSAHRSPLTTDRLEIDSAALTRLVDSAMAQVMLR